MSAGLYDRRWYVASRASVPERPAMWRAFRDRGIKIVSTWIDEAGEGETADNGELWQRIDREIEEADGLILYAEPGDFPLKGAYIEVGMALARRKPVFVVAPLLKLEPHTLRPLGSWAAHPGVTFCQSVTDALCWPPTPTTTPTSRVPSSPQTADPEPGMNNGDEG